MEHAQLSLKQMARLAGFLYVLMSVQAPIALLYVPSHIIVKEDPAATINNIVGHEFLFRLSIISQFASIILFVVLALVLYRLLGGVNHYQAKLLFALVVVQVPIIFFIETFHLTALMIAKENILKAYTSEEKQALVVLLTSMHSYGMMALEIFWGLWLVPFGLLVYKSGFIPKIFGICLFIGAIGWIWHSVTFILFPSYHPFVSKYIEEIGAVGEFPIVLWLLIKGVKK